MWIQSAGFKQFQSALSVLLLTGLVLAGCTPGTPEGSSAASSKGTAKSNSRDAVKKPAEPVTDPGSVQTTGAVGAGQDEKPSVGGDAPQANLDFPMPDLSLLSDAAFQRNAKMGRLVAKRRCILCHKIEGRGAVLQPPLVQVSMRRMKRMLDYEQYLDQLQSGDPDRYSAGLKTFDAIRQEQDALKSMRLWLKGYLKQPTFDNSQAKMPLQVLLPAEIEQLACYVIQLAVEGYQKGETPLED